MTMSPTPDLTYFLHAVVFHFLCFPVCPSYLPFLRVRLSLIRRGRQLHLPAAPGLPCHLLPIIISNIRAPASHAVIARLFSQPRWWTRCRSHFLVSYFLCCYSLCSLVTWFPSASEFLTPAHDTCILSFVHSGKMSHFLVSGSTRHRWSPVCLLHSGISWLPASSLVNPPVLVTHLCSSPAWTSSLPTRRASTFHNKLSQ